MSLKRVIEKCSDLNQNWLLRGRGDKRLVNNSDNGNPIYTDLSLRDSLPDFDQSCVIGKIKTRISDEIESAPLVRKKRYSFYQVEGRSCRRCYIFDFLTGEASLKTVEAK